MFLDWHTMDFFPIREHIGHPVRWTSRAGAVAVSNQAVSDACSSRFKNMNENKILVIGNQHFNLQASNRGKNNLDNLQHHHNFQLNPLWEMELFLIKI